MASASGACSSGGDASSPDLANDAAVDASPESLPGNGRILYSELVEGVRVDFVSTDFGTLTTASGSLDELDADKIGRIRERLERSTLSEAFRSLHADDSKPQPVPAALTAADAETEAARVKAEGALKSDVSRQLNEPFANEVAEKSQAPIKVLAGVLAQDNKALAADQASNAAVSSYFGCTVAQTCQVGKEWATGGRRGRITNQTTYFINQSASATADLGIRFSWWSYSLGAWQYSTVARVQNQATRSWRSYTIHNVVGLYKREAFIGNRRAQTLDGPEITFGASLGASPSVSLLQYWTEFEFKGYQSTTLTNTESRCANKVVSAFNNVPKQPTANIRYKSRGGSALPPFNATLAEFAGNNSHIQGMGRLTVDDRRWFAVSRARPDVTAGGGGGVFLVNLDNLGASDGRRLVSAAEGLDAFAGEPPAYRATQYYYPMAGTSHSSGLQTMGRFAAVAADGLTGKNGFVDIFDFATPGSTSALLQRLLIQPLPAVYNNVEVAPGREISGAAIARLKAGNYLLFALDKSEKKRGWFYVSSTQGGASLKASTIFNTFDYTTLPAQFGNVALVTECGTGDLYMIGTENDELGVTSDGVNEAWLMKLAYDPGTEQVTVAQSWMRSFGPNTDAFCTFRAAATSYVDPDGRLLLYCHTRKANTDILGNPDSKLKLVEFAP
jgi:hypothetical protein